MKRQFLPEWVTLVILFAMLAGAFGINHVFASTIASSRQAQSTVVVTPLVTDQPTQAATETASPEATATGAAATATSQLTPAATATGQPGTPGTPEATATPTAQVPPAGTPQLSGALAVAESLQQVYQGIYERVNPSVVNISTQRPGPSVDPDALPFNHPLLPEGGISRSLGSGFVWDNLGHIVTNAHVVEGASRITVTFSNGTTAAAELVGAAAGADLAVVRVDLQDPSLLRPVTVGSSDALAVGQLVVAIGSPLGLQGTMTTGIISALDRDLPVGEPGSLAPRFSIPGVIQTDASINPGNSGGVLTDIYGRVIGVNTAIRSTNEGSVGLGFAVPAAIVQRVVPALIEEGRFQFPYLGVSGAMLTDEMRRQLELPAGQNGFLVTGVSEGSPAEQAGLRPSQINTAEGEPEVATLGDIITAVEGQPLTRFAQLSGFLITRAEVGQAITLQVLRGGQTVNVEVTLAARPEPAAPRATVTPAARATATPGSGTAAPGAGTATPAPDAGATYLGIVGTGLTPTIAAAMDLPDDQRGVLVLRVQAGSPAEEAGLRGSFTPAQVDGDLALVGGDVITAVDGDATAEMTDLQAALAAHEAGDEIELTILRGGAEQTVQVTLAARP